MKKIIIALLMTHSVFALSLEERVEILEKKVENLEKKLQIVDNSQKKQINEDLIKTCQNINLVNYSFIYNNAGLIKSYDFKYKFKNNYKKTIKYIYGSISFIDNEESKLLEDYIKKSILIKPNQVVTLKTNYLINDGDLAEYIKDTPKSKLKVKFHPYVIIFQNGQKINCN